MIKVFDFRCTNGHVFEEFVDGTVTATRCGCGANATKIVSATQHILEGASGDFPGRHMKWVREHEQAGQSSRES
jgi:predicted homoserine dehydrogenase-like protein